MPNGITSGLAFLAGLGLPQVLLWVLTFAIVYAVLTKAKIFSRAPATLISVVAGVFVLLAVPATVIAVIASMSTGLVVAGIAVLVLIALLEVAGAKHLRPTPDGKAWQGVRWIEGHGTAMAALMILAALVIFYVSGGAALLGIGIPAFGYGTWVLILVGIAVLWMMSESPKKIE
ncbi:MAG: hypothetical protein GTN36_01690 [Candidatus Aenigmarchaeota archaeon]|nr:hypothetical protein [Candidatus Aenigmarchaeota archaeon]